MLTNDALLATVGAVPEPVLGKSLKELRMASAAQCVGGNAAHVEIELPTPAYPSRETLANTIRQAVRAAHPDLTDIRVDFTVRTRGKDSGGALGLRVKNVVAVGSGKGGVGKSTVAASIAFGLQTLGAKVGLMDADVYGPSIPHMLGAKGQPELTEIPGPDGKPIRRIKPIERNGLKIMSMGFFVPEDEAVVWRGPMLHGAITQFLKDTEWGELDYLIIDLPPGTGDVSLTLSQLLGLAGAVVVCTPQQVALLDAVKAIAMFRKVKIPVLGMVENMTGEIFGQGGAHKKADEMGVPFLGEIPINSVLRVHGDEGRTADNFSSDCPVRSELLAICQNVAMQIVRELSSGPALPTLEIL